MMQEDFINSMMPYALSASKQLGLDPRLIIAQSALETGYGQHAPGNNFFGIKSHGMPNGQTMSTTEYGPNGAYQTKDSFRRYGNMGESVQGYVDFMKSNPRYKGLLNATGLDNQIAELQKSGYATSGTYGKDVSAIAKKINVPADAMTNLMTSTPVPQPSPSVMDPALAAKANTGTSTPWQTVVNSATDAQNTQSAAAQKLEEDQYKELMAKGLGLLAMGQPQQMQPLPPGSPLMHQAQTANLFRGLLG